MFNIKTLLLVISILIITACNNTGTNKTPATDTTTQNPVTVLEQQIEKDGALADSLRPQLVEKLVEAGQYKKALLHIDKLLAKDTANPGFLYMKADALERLGDTVAAIAHYEKALHEAGIFTDAQFRTANLYAETGNPKTIAVCDDLLQQPGGIRMRSDILLIKGIYYSNTHQYQQAIAIYDQIIKEDYSYLNAYIEKGLVYYDQKKFKEALEIFRMSTTIKNSFADGYYWMAKTEEQLNRTEDATNNYKRALALDQSLEEARTALKRLGAIN